MTALRQIGGGYPAAYRQSRWRVPSPSGFPSVVTKLPRPANDNFKVSRYPDDPMKKYRRWTRIGAGGVARRLPLGRAIELGNALWDIYSNINPPREGQPRGFSWYGWQEVFKCGAFVYGPYHSLITIDCSTRVHILKSDWYANQGIGVDAKFAQSLRQSPLFPDRFELVGAARYHKNINWTHPLKWYYPTHPGIIPTPELPTWYNPMFTPIKQPAPQPKPPKWRQIPNRRPIPWLVERTEMGYGAQAPGPIKNIGWRTRGRRFEKIVNAPTGRPGKDTKEVKLVLSLAQHTLLGQLVNVLFESTEIVWIVYRALPRNLQHFGRDKTIQAKMRTVYNNFHSIDWKETIYELLLNQIEDMIYGLAGRAGAKVNSNLNMNGASKLFGEMIANGDLDPEDLLEPFMRQPNEV